MKIQRIGLAGALLLTLGTSASAQLAIGGSSVVDGVVGPLTAGLYHVTSDILIGSDKQLTILPGATLKFGPGVRLRVLGGNLIAQGTAAQPVILTSYADDGVGGDTWLDGATVGQPADWDGLVGESGGASLLLEHVVIQYGERGVGITSSTDLDMSNCFVNASGLQGGLRFQGTGNNVSVHDCAFDNGLGFAVDGVPLSRVPDFLNNTAAGNLLGNGIAVTSFALDGDLTIQKPSVINGGLIVNASAASVPLGRTLTMGPGTGFLMLPGTGVLWSIRGTFRAAGTAAEPVVMTSIADDDWFGDSQSDGPTSGTPGDWNGVLSFDDSSSQGLIDFDHAVVRYAGGGGWNAIRSISDGAFQVSNSVIAENLNSGVNGANGDGFMSVVNCAILNNGEYAIEGMEVDNLANCSGNTAAGNALGDVIDVSDFSPSVDVTLGPDNVINGALLISASGLSVPAGVTLTLEAGMALKFRTGSKIFNVDGTLRVRGAEGDPVVFTVSDDDEHFGDSTNNGPTTGLPGQWDGIVVRPSGVYDVDHALFRFAGSGGRAAVYAEGGDVTLTNSMVRDADSHGIRLRSVDASYTIVNNDFENNNGVAVSSPRLSALVGFDGNRAAGNAEGDFIRITDGSTHGVDVELERRNLINGALAMDGSLTVETGSTLTLHRGVVLKWLTASLLYVDGTLRALGTGYDPVVLTTLADDDYAGDSNGDGPSTGTPGSWYGLRVEPGATEALLEHVVVRHAGWVGSPGIKVDEAGVATLRSVRVERCAAAGFSLEESLVEGTNLVAFDNRDGFVLQKGGTNLVHATACGNAEEGFHDTGWTGQVWNSLAWDNGTNFQGFAAGELFFSNGDASLAGVDGNVNVDPLFVSSATGDLRLAAGSPVQDIASRPAAIAVEKDFDENSRLLRTSSSVSLQADMGAYERAKWSLEFEGPGVVGSAADLTVTGAPGMAVHAIGFLDATIFTDPYGFVLLGILPVYLLEELPVGQTCSLFIPLDPTLVGLDVAFQSFVYDVVDILDAHMTNVIRIHIGPALP